MAEELVLKCGYCFTTNVPMLSWQEFSNGTVHLRAECPECKRYIKYLPQRNTLSGVDVGPTKWARAMGVVE